jgi:hypothetical protein
MLPAPLLLERRYENVVQIRCLYEGVTVDEMLEGWEKMLPHKMEEWKLQRDKVGSMETCEVLRWTLGVGCAQGKVP